MSCLPKLATLCWRAVKKAKAWRATLLGHATKIFTSFYSYPHHQINFLGDRGLSNQEEKSQHDQELLFQSYKVKQLGNLVEHVKSGRHPQLDCTQDPNLGECCQAIWNISELEPLRRPRSANRAGFGQVRGENCTSRDARRRV